VKRASRSARIGSLLFCGSSQNFGETCENDVSVVRILYRKLCLLQNWIQIEKNFPSGSPSPMKIFMGVQLPRGCRANLNHVEHFVIESFGGPHLDPEFRRFALRTWNRDILFGRVLDCFLSRPIAGSQAG